MRFSYLFLKTFLAFQSRFFKKNNTGVKMNALEVDRRLRRLIIELKRKKACRYTSHD